MQAVLSCESGCLSLRCGDLDLPRRPIDTAPLLGFARTYILERASRDPAPLLKLGQDLRAWFDGGEDWLNQLRAVVTPHLELEIRAPRIPDAAAWAVLHAPWELLADQHGFLAQDDRLRYAPVRRLGPPAQPAPLDDYRLGIAFMAAAPRRANELDFEAEEAAILTAAGQLDLFVEESGDPAQLGPRLVALNPPLPVLHLSCHGHNAWKGPDGKTRPVLMLEDAEGGEKPTTAEALTEAFGAYKPRLLFVSACLTAAAPEPADGAAVLTDSLATGLIRNGIPAVLGWDGSVADSAATAFAQHLYHQLGPNRQSLTVAVASARRALLNGGATALQPALSLGQQLTADPDVLRRNWHLARLWVGPDGGGPLVGGDEERPLQAADRGARIVLAARGTDQLEVASPAMFVGRRRELQRALRSLRDRGALLLHGMGRLGKSSLAARIADRRPDLTLVVVHAHYDATSIVDALLEGLQNHPDARTLLETRRPEIRNDPAKLRPLLVDLLNGPCKGARNTQCPILLLIDDLERILEPDPNGGRHTVRLTERPVIAALLNAFTPERGRSRLLFTSRFPFTLRDSGRDRAKAIETLELSELTDTARRKLALRQARAATLQEDDLIARFPLLLDAESVARGNPGLQDLLGRDFVLREAVPQDRAKAVLGEMTEYLQGGALPPTEGLREFLQNLAISELLSLAGAGGQALTRAMTLFNVPVPDAAITALAKIVGGTRQRLSDLGLLVPTPDLVNHKEQAWSVNGLAAGRQTPLTDAEQHDFAAEALPALFEAWGGVNGADARPYDADIELTRLALAAVNPEVAETCAADAVRGLAPQNPAAAGTLGQAAIALLEAAGRALPLRLLAWTAEALQTAGDGAAADAVLSRGTALTPGDELSLGDAQLTNYLFALGKRQVQAGNLDAALRTFDQLCALETRLGRERQVAVVRGSIADILQARGDLDEALRIRHEEELPVYTRLGDVRSIAVTQGRIADILEARGDLDEALRIRREEQLPVFTRLGDVREIAVAQGKIADILQARGDLDEALRIRREETLPVYTRLGEVRSIAVTQGKIADILQSRGDLDGALSLQEQCLATNRRLGDIDGIASTLWSIAQIRLAQEDPAKAFECLQEGWSLFLRLGRAEGIAVVGALYGQFLAVIEPGEAPAVFRQSAAAFRKLGRDAEAEQVEAMLRDLNNPQQNPGDE